MSDREPTDDAAVARLQPPVTDASAPFWMATHEQHLVLPWCVDCDRPFFYPRPFCPTCLGSAIEWREARGTGTVHAVTVEHRPQQPGLRSMAPLAIALVELDEGVRLLTNIVGCPPGEVVVGQAVTVTWEPLDDGRNLPLFTPTA